MKQVTNYARVLRPVGQMLEPLKLDSFSLKIDDSGVRVSGHKSEERRLPPPVPKVSLRVVWEALRRKPLEPVRDSQPEAGLLEVRYTVDEIERRDIEERSKRKDPGGTPEAHALSQILRAVGGYVDQKGGRLVEVRKAAGEITIEYESALRKKMTEQFTVASLYDYWVRMYLRRKKS